MKTNKSEFAIFKKTCQTWIEKLGLKDWHVDIIHDSIDVNNIATCTLGYNSQTAILTFNIENILEKRLKASEIKEVALHEVLELLLADIGCLVESRNFDENIYEQTTHKIINRLIKVL